MADRLSCPDSGDVKTAGEGWIGAPGGQGNRKKDEWFEHSNWVGDGWTAPKYRACWTPSIKDYYYYDTYAECKAKCGGACDDEGPLCPSNACMRINPHTDTVQRTECWEKATAWKGQFCNWGHDAGKYCPSCAGWPAGSVCEGCVSGGAKGCSAGEVRHTYKCATQDDVNDLKAVSGDCSKFQTVAAQKQRDGTCFRWKNFPGPVTDKSCF